MDFNTIELVFDVPINEERICEKPLPLYLSTRKPAISNTKNIINKTLKYFPIVFCIFLPKNLRATTTIKNRPPIPSIEAKNKTCKEILNLPAEIVRALYGIGVNAPAKMLKKALFAYFSPTTATAL
jgi:hypothetical protein